MPEQDWFQQNAPATQTGGDWFATNAPPSSNADLDAQLHAAYDNRPLWRKALGLEPENLSPELQQYQAQQKQAAQKQIADQLQGVYSGYGEGVKEGLKTVPYIVMPGLAGEAAASAVGGGALGTAANIGAQGLTSAAIAKAQGASNTGAVIAGGLGAAAPALEADLPALASPLESSAVKQYSQVLNPTTKGNKFLTETQVAPGLVERGTTAVSMKSLQKQAQQNLEQVGQMISDAWSNLPSGTTTELQPVLDSLDSSAQDALTIQTSAGTLKPTTTFAARALDSVDQMKTLLEDVAEPNPTTGVLEVPVDKVRKLRQVWDDVAALGKRYQGADLADYASAQVHGMAADAIREQLGQQFPDIDALNKEYSFWKNVDKVVGDTITRRTGQAKPLGQKMAQAAGTGAGFVTGGIPGALVGRKAMQAVEQVITSTAWGTVSAVMKDRLANALASGDTNAIIDLTSRISSRKAVDWSQFPLHESSAPPTPPGGITAQTGGTAQPLAQPPPWMLPDGVTARANKQ